MATTVTPPPSDASHTQQQQHHWNTRGRLRAQARYVTQQRMKTTTTVESTTTTDDNNRDSDDIPRIQSILWRIIRNDLSVFSLPSIASQYDFFQQPFSSAALWWHNDAAAAAAAEETVLLAGEQSLRSRYGAARVEQLRTLATRSTHCTFLTYACWMERYSVVGLLLVGGVHPFFSTDSTTNAGNDLYTLALPLSMKRYIVQQLMARRVERILLSDEDVYQCDACQQPSPSAAPLTNSHCSHAVCEPCLWQHIHAQAFVERPNCVDCPLCFTGTTTTVTLDGGTPAERTARRLASRQRFYELPVDAAALKGRRKQPKRRRLLAPNWTTALPDRIGQSQTVRADRCAAPEQPLPLLRACLAAGMDVHLYHRSSDGLPTLLLQAVYSNAIERVRLLLYYGAADHADDNDTTTATPTITTCWDVAVRWGYTEIMELLQAVGATVPGPQLLREEDLTRDGPEPPMCTMLVDGSAATITASSFFIDDCINDASVAALIAVYQTLPVEPLPAKKEHLRCSRRSYYFDACGYLTERLARVIGQALQVDESSVKVYPSMRFLSYTETGTTLAPHIDLSRTDPTTGQRSTHSFLLYLTECTSGGATALLRGLTGPERWDRWATVAPRRGRLLVFPHVCPHEGMEVECVPKLLIRGEVYVPDTNR